jgi:hypothetical protein
MKALFTLFLGLSIIASTSKGLSQGKLQDWQELVAFHKVMSQTFHPSEEGNLEPIKTRIGEMVEKAKTLQTSKIPADFNNKKVKKAVAKLYKDSKALEKKIKAGASDDEIKISLTKLHDVFHEIVGLCSANEEHDHDHEHKEGEGHKH